MKASELRIGNLVMRGLTGEATHIYGHGITELAIEEIAHPSKKPMYLPLPITEEWLLKFGFGKYSAPENINGVKHVFNVDEAVLLESIGDIKGGLHIMCICRGDYFRDNLHYVHQLQNLYFALTGEELALKSDIV